MTTELFYLTLTALLAGSLWIPFIVGVNMHADETVTDFTRVPDVSKMPWWVQRANRAHLNLLEQFLPMAVLVLTAHIAGVSNMVTAWTMIAFFWIRVIHAAGMITALTRFPLRSIVFTGGWACILIYGWQIVWGQGA